MGSAEPELQIPSDWVQTLSSLSQVHQTYLSVMLIKALRSDRLVTAARDFAKLVLGDEFMQEGAGFKLEDIVEDDKGSTRPVLMLAAPGFDFSGQIEDLALKTSRPLKSYAMGTADAALAADKMLPQATKSGSWLLLKNVHLDIAYLSQLGKALQRLTPHTKFRLFL